VRHTKTTSRLRLHRVRNTYRGISLSRPPAEISAQSDLLLRGQQSQSSCLGSERTVLLLLECHHIQSSCWSVCKVSPPARVSAWGSVQSVILPGYQGTVLLLGCQRSQSSCQGVSAQSFCNSATKVGSPAIVSPLLALLLKCHHSQSSC
jgi:hypothetical protein